MTLLLDGIGEKIAAGRPLDDADAATLGAATDIVSLGMMADGVRRRRHGARTTFVRVAHVEVTEAAAGVVSWPGAAREIRLAGGFPGIDEAVAAVRYVAAAGVPVSAFSLHDLVGSADSAGVSLLAWMRRLHEAGLSAVTAAPLDLLQAPRAAAAALSDAGLAVGAWTIDGARSGDPLAPIRAVQQLEREGCAVRVFAPVPRRRGPEPTTGYADVKAVALARILLDVPHIQVDWTLHGPKLAQVALTFGADDVDNVSALDETAEGPRRAPLEEIRRNIQAAALEPVERDGRFSPVA